MDSIIYIPFAIVAIFVMIDLHRIANALRDIADNLDDKP